MRRWIAPLAAVLALVGAAEAHGPTRQKVTERIEIKAPPAKVWSVVGNFQDLSWHPAIEATLGKGGNAPEATRTLTLKGGGTIEEALDRYDADAMSLGYRIVRVDPKVLPVTNYASTISVKPGPDGGSLVEWRGAFYRGFPNNDPPPELSDEAAVKAITGVYRAGLDALKKRLEAPGS